MKLWKKIQCSPHLYRKRRFDQIWPNLKLTKKQKRKFKRNEIMFAREIKKPIKLNLKIQTLKSHFNRLNYLKSDILNNLNFNSVYNTLLRKLTSNLKFILKFNKSLLFAQMKKAIFNDFLSLKSAFLAPGVLRIRKIKWSYAKKIKSMNRLRLMLGLIKMEPFIKIFQKSTRISDPNKIWKFLKTIESLILVVLTKMGFSLNILQTSHMIKHSKICINGFTNNYKYTAVVPGDFISILNKNENKLFLAQNLSFFNLIMWNLVSHRQFNINKTLKKPKFNTKKKL